jgi:uncharacterized protein YjdB
MKRWKKGMAWLLSVLCILVTVQIPSIPAKAVEKYNASVAVEYAINNWNKSNELCAGFISNCLWAGGLTSFPYRATADICEYGNLTSYGFEKNNLSYTGTGSIKNNGTNAGKVDIGDIIVYRCFAGCDYTYWHVAIVSQIKSDGEVCIADTNGACKGQGYVNVPAGWYIDGGGHGYGNAKLTIECYHYVGVTNQRPEGAADVIEAVGNKRIHVYGWAYDPDAGASTPLEIHVYLGTESNQVETFVGKTVTSFKRENNYLGYDVTLDVPISGEKYVYVWALDSSGENNNRMIGSKKIYIPSDTIKPTISNLQVIQKNKNGYILQCNVSDNVGVSKVEFSTCTEASGKTDWKTYTVTDIVNGVVTCEIKTSDFADREGKYYTDVYAYDAAGNKTDWAKENTYYPYIDRTAPVVISAEITSCDKDGYNVTATATDNVGVTVIKFPSWNSGGTEDDIVWYEGTPVVNGTSTCRINIKDMKSGNGKYWTDIRAYDADGNVSGLTSINHLPVRIDSDAPTISNITTTKLSDTSYKVSCKVTDDNLQSVQFGTSVNGELPVWKKVSATDGVYEAIISMDDFFGEEGNYLTTIKAIDTFGNESAMVAELVSLDAKKPLTGIALNKTEIELEKGTTETLTVSYDPADTTDSKETLWACSDYSVATVENGVVTAVGKGNAIITARCGRYTATCNITVTEKDVTPDPKPTEKPLTGITLNKETLELEKGATESLTVGYAPEDTTDNKDVIWTSSEEAVATVTDGTITAVGKGTAIITAKVGNCEASCTVKVTEEEVNPSPTDKPSPTPSEDPKPTPSEDPKPTPSEDPKPTPSEDPKPTPSEDPEPTPSEDPKPTPSEDPKPTPSVNPDPAPTDKPKPVVKPDVPADRPVSQHTHNFNWVTVQKASTTQDGIEELKCDCGMVKESSIIPASQAYVNELYQNLGKASENGEVSFDSGRIYTISDYLIKKLQDRPDVVTTITFEYDHKKYQMIIPAGADYTELLEDEEYFYGYFYFAKKVGAKVEEL